MNHMVKILTSVLILSVLVLIGCDSNNTPSNDPGIVEGIVTNFNTGELVGGIVINDGTTDLATTNSNGYYSFEIEKGTYTLTFSGNGFVPYFETNVEVAAGETVTLNIQIHPISIIEISSNIAGNVNWTNGNIYHINNPIQISATLTIQAGTVIKFKDNAAWTVMETGGEVVAVGTVQLPIIFTSWHDDVAGGDTNGDGNATVPARGDWEDIVIRGEGNDSNFDYCCFRYGGGNDEQVVRLNAGTTVSITNSTFAHNLGEDGALNAALAGSATVVQENLFYDNVWPLQINMNFDLDASNSFFDPSNRGLGNDYDGILVGNYMTDGIITWDEADIPFVFTESDYQIPAGNSVTLSEGIVIKFAEDVRWEVDGVLTANGTQSNPIYFTSLKDDSVDGDTNEDGIATSPVAGDWFYIKVRGLNNTSSFTSCKFLYGGGYDDDYTLCLYNDTGVSVNFCLFKYNVGTNNATLDAGAAGSGTVIAGNTFYFNEKPLQINGSISLDETNMCRNPNNYTQANTYNGIFIDSPGEVCSIEGDVTWAENEYGVAFVSLYQGININVGNSLTLAEDVILKFDGGSIDYEGNNLINYDASGVFFTSWYDDEHGGDTNGDGISVGTIGDWEGISNQGIWENWANILYSEY
ncbi:MAG: carboxypeptidase-like regulatory domain-containing protein [Candidatus Cloacimonadales bacterium]|nr:carboxypeptidase-like regulatory domain-containing protein [Candidatus Cloacimonadales bacterium]